MAELGQLHFCSLQISFSIQTFWGHSLQIRVNSAMVRHDTVCNSIEYTVLYSVFIMYASHITLHYITVCLITLLITFRLNTGRSYRGTNFVLPLDLKSYSSGELWSRGQDWWKGNWKALCTLPLDLTSISGFASGQWYSLMFMGVFSIGILQLARSDFMYIQLLHHVWRKYRLTVK